MTTNRSGHPKARILVVDDMPHNARLLRTYLEMDDYEVMEAYEAEEGIKLALSEKPDVILLDIMMPKMDGYQVCEILRKNEETRGIPIVMITALSGVDDKTRALEVGADDFISKPFNRAEIVARVKSLIRVRFYQSLLAETQKMDAIIADMADGIVIMNEHWEVQKANRAARNLLNLPMDDLNGLDMLGYLGRFQLSIPPLELFASTRTANSFEVIRTDLDLPLYLAAKLTRVFDPSGRIDSMALTLRDVTDEKLSEQLQSDFLSFISHKLRTPITVIRGFMNLCTDGAYGELSEKLSEALQRAQRKAEELDTLHEKLITYVNCMVTPREIDPCGTVDFALETVWEAVKGRYPGRQTQLVKSLDPACEAVVVGQEHLEILLEALLDNAVKFCD